MCITKTLSQYKENTAAGYWFLQALLPYGSKAYKNHDKNSDDPHSTAMIIS